MTLAVSFSALRCQQVELVLQNLRCHTLDSEDAVSTLGSGCWYWPDTFSNLMEILTFIEDEKN